MYSENIIKDSIYVCKAIVLNIMAMVSRSGFVQFVKETGRGPKTKTAEELKNYFREVFFDYMTHLDVDHNNPESFVAGKKVLEYGPGNTLGVAILFYAFGAERVTCVDRFPLTKVDQGVVDIYKAIINSLDGERKERAESVFVEKGRPESGFRKECIEYRVTPDGLSHGDKEFDLLISRAVLEHVNKLDQTFTDMKNTLKPDGWSIHKVGLRSHGLDRYRDLDFLTWSPWLYNIMHSHKGYPNRYRVDVYKDELAKNQFQILKFESTGQSPQENVDFIRPHLHESFKNVNDEDLGSYGFWFIAKHK